VLDLDAALFAAITEVNVLGTFRGTRAALDVMVPREGGVVVNITGRGDDLRAARLTAAYGASKAWIRSFSRSVAAELKESSVRVIPVNPGIMTTERMDPDAHEAPVADERTLRLFATVTRMLGDPPEVAAAALISFLDRDPAALPKELRVLGAARVVKGLGAEAGRVGAAAGSRMLNRRP
jgi:NAD(P)-dependent dehydrogenase (short-subunit alcohol dehydrogenase family)